MYKLCVTLLIALSAHAYAREPDSLLLSGTSEQINEFVETLSGRAVNMGREDFAANLDATTLGKGEKKVAASAPSRGSSGVSRPGSAGASPELNKRDGTQRNARGERVFGGRTQKLSGVGLPIMEEFAVPSFWDNTRKSLSGSNKKSYKPPVASRGVSRPGSAGASPELNKRDGKERNARGERVFGGRTQKLSGVGLPIMQEPEKGKGWFAIPSGTGVAPMGTAPKLRPRAVSFPRVGSAIR
jgi:hypothetical protein